MTGREKEIVYHMVWTNLTDCLHKQTMKSE